MVATTSSPAAAAPVDFEDPLPLLRLPVLLTLVVPAADPALPLLFLAFLLSEAVLMLAGTAAGTD
jgi:hypothetical protein